MKRRKGNFKENTDTHRSTENKCIFSMRTNQEQYQKSEEISTKVKKDDQIITDNL